MAVSGKALQNLPAYATDMTLGTVCRIVTIKARLGTLFMHDLEVLGYPGPRRVTVRMMT